MQVNTKDIKINRCRHVVTFPMYLIKIHFQKRTFFPINQLTNACCQYYFFDKE